MTDKRFSHPVTVNFPTVQVVATARAAALVLMDVRWPKKGPRHRDATETCLKVIDGHRSTEDAEVAFREAAEEANILA